MKSIGIEIKNTKAIFFAIEKDGDDYTILNENYKYLELADDTDNDEIRRFTSAVHSFFDTISADRIAIIKRNPNAKGKYAVSCLSFKVEGLIQTYASREVEFVTSLKVSGYFKKNTLPFNTKYDYQVGAAKLSYFLCND